MRDHEFSDSLSLLSLSVRAMRSYGTTGDWDGMMSSNTHARDRLDGVKRSWAAYLIIGPENVIGAIEAAFFTIETHLIAIRDALLRSEGNVRMDGNEIVDTIDWLRMSMEFVDLHPMKSPRLAS